MLAVAAASSREHPDVRLSQSITHIARGDEETSLGGSRPAISVWPRGTRRQAQGGL